MVHAQLQASGPLAHSTACALRCTTQQLAAVLQSCSGGHQSVEVSLSFMSDCLTAAAAPVAYNTEARLESAGGGGGSASASGSMGRGQEKVERPAVAPALDKLLLNQAVRAQVDARGPDVLAGRSHLDLCFRLGSRCMAALRPARTMAAGPGAAPAPALPGPWVATSWQPCPELYQQCLQASLRAK